MLEKNSVVILTEDDIQQYNAGVVSKRVADSWGFSYEELKQLIEEKTFQLSKE